METNLRALGFAGPNATPCHGGLPETLPTARDGVTPLLPGSEGRAWPCDALRAEIGLAPSAPGRLPGRRSVRYFGAHDFGGSLRENRFPSGSCQVAETPHGYSLGG